MQNQSRTRPSLMCRWDHCGIDCALYYADEMPALLELGAELIQQGINDLLFETIHDEQVSIYTLAVQNIPGWHKAEVRIKSNSLPDLHEHAALAYKLYADYAILIEGED